MGNCFLNVIQNCFVYTSLTGPYNILLLMQTSDDLFWFTSAVKPLVKNKLAHTWIKKNPKTLKGFFWFTKIL